MLKSLILVLGITIMSLWFSSGTTAEDRIQPQKNLIQPQNNLRIFRYTSRSSDEAKLWQVDLRQRLFMLLKMEDLISLPISERGGKEDKVVIRQEAFPTYLLEEIEFNSTLTRKIRAVLTIPTGQAQAQPGVVCIHGHGGNRFSPYDRAGIYRGFASELAERGVVTIAVDVGQHEVYESGRALMGERLWDVIRCVDFLCSLPMVDSSKIGCAGLSLGGEMAMWLGAMDERVSATVSAGFLTRMDQMEKQHCPCWKFEGLRQLVDWADVYSLIAPRALLCQNGLKEPPADFTVPLAQEALAEIQVIYKDFGAEDKLGLAVHSEGHVIDLPSLLQFFQKNLDF